MRLPHQPTSGFGLLKPRGGRDSAALRRHDPKSTVFLQPGCALVANQRAANLAGIVAQADADDFETFRVLVAAEPVSQELAHAVDRRLYLGIICEFEDSVDALPEFGIGQADDDAGAHLGMRYYRSLDLGRIAIPSRRNGVLARRRDNDMCCRRRR